MPATAVRKLGNSALWRANAIVFVGGGCTMVLELIAGRLMAPYIGVSLYTWTSIIGVVLAGISLGNYLGGRLADRHARPVVLGAVFLAAGVASLAILPGIVLLSKTPLPTSLHLMNRSLLYSALIFFVPTTVLGMITPLVIKLTLQDLGKTGNVVGTIYAVSTVGAIVGTFATGFWLVSWFGTRTIVWLVAVVLIGLGVISGGMWKGGRQSAAAMGVLVIFALSLSFKGSFDAPFLRESNYYAIGVYDWLDPESNRQLRVLKLDRLDHSFADPKDPTFLYYDYEQIFAQLAAYQARKDPEVSALFVGGGGYTLPRYMEVVYPRSTLDVVEIDPAVTETAYEQLGLPADTRVRTFNMDARFFFTSRQARGEDQPKYDLVFADAFNDYSVPYHLTTVEFHRMVKEVMADGGFYLLNVIDDYQKGRFLASFAQTLRQVFPTVFLAAPQGWLGGTGAGTYVLVATDREYNLGEWLVSPAAPGLERMELEVIPPDKLAERIEQNRGIVLTDNFVPVDNMVSFLFAHR
ncbi:MAG: fused MFS/spermidine synthase [Chloroflexi bacterium]|nr:fused MFS/spermidine synthase [Chloroflexota bacterium]